MQSERTAILVRHTLILGIILVVLWILGQVLLEIFAGILLALLLDGFTQRLSAHLRLPRGWALFAVIVSIAAILTGASFYLTPRVIEQSYQIEGQATAAIDRLSGLLSKLNVSPSKIPDLHQLLTGFVHFGATATEVFVVPFVILFIGFYGAVNPGLYVDGFVRLFPLRLRDRAREVLAEASRSLRWWLLGRAVTMLAVTIMAFVGFSIISLPLALTLSLLTGLLTFVPYLGAIIAAVPSLLIAYLQSPLIAAYTLGIYISAHIVEGYIVAPLVQQRTVHLAPALLLGSQVVLGALFGVWGIALAAPTVVILMVIIRLYYLRDVLGESETLST